MMNMRKVARIGLRLLGPALLIYFLLSIQEPDLVWRTLRDADPWLVLLSVVLVVPFLFLKGLRWQYILRIWNIPLPLLEATALYVISIFLGVVTPGQAGDAVKAWYLRKRGYSLSTGLASVVVDRLFDVGIMGLLAATGLYFFWDILPGGRLLNVIVVAGLLIAVVLGLLLATSRGLRALLFERVLPRLVPNTIKAKFRERWSKNAGSLTSLHLTPPQIGIITALTVAGLVWTFLRIYLMFLALEIPIAIGPFIALVAILALIQPATPGGVGGRDAALVIVLSSLLQIDRDQAVARALSLSALLLLLNLENVVIGFVVSLRYPLTEMRQEALSEAELQSGESA